MTTADNGKTLILNGCSYGECWGTVYDLGPLLDCQYIKNLSKSGSSNSRIFRSTLNYLAENTADFVVLMLTAWDRMEAPWGESIGDFTSEWVDYGPNGIINQDTLTEFPGDFYQNYIQERYRYDIDIRYVEKLLCDLVTMTGWMDSRGIKYLVFSACGGLFTKCEPMERYGAKIELIRQNPRIIDLETWCSNQFLHECGAQPHSTDITCDAAQSHYLASDHTSLNDFVYNYIINNDLL